MALRPLHDRILVQRIEEEEQNVGGIIIRGARSFRMDEVFVAIIVIAIIGVLLTSAVAAVERYLLRWRT